MQAPDKKCKLSFFIKDTYTGDASDPLSLNLYTYCHNEPIMYTDPDGHKWVRREVAPSHYETIWAEDLTWEQYKKMSSKDQIDFFERYYFDEDIEKNLGPGRATQKGAWEEALQNSVLYRTWKGETLAPGATALGLSAADTFGVQPAILVGYLGNWLFRGKDAADYEWTGWQNGWNIIQGKAESYTVKSKDDVDFYNSFRPKVDLANGIYGLITGARSGWKSFKGLRDMRLPVAETFVDAGTGEKIRVSNSGNAQTQPSILQIEQNKYVNSSKSNVSVGGKNNLPELGSKTGYKFKEGVDLDLRGTGNTYKNALDEAFKRTGVPKENFVVTKWAKDANGKSFPVEWKAENGAKVNIDIGHTTDGPDVPHIGYQTGGKRSNSGSGVRGHIMVDDVPVNRSK